MPPYKSSQGATASQPKPRKKKPEEREVSISGLIACAEAIAKKPPKQFVVPFYAAQCAARAIKLRKRSTQWHGSQIDGLEEFERVAHAEDDESHAVFTSTLEHTLNILRPFIRKPQFADEEKEKISRHGSINDITNRFSKLEIEELADQEVDNAAVAIVEKSPATPRITYVVDNSEHERWVAMCCLLMDYNCVKEFIRSNWHEYLLVGLLTLSQRWRRRRPPFNCSGALCTI